MSANDWNIVKHNINKLLQQKLGVLYMFQEPKRISVPLGNAYRLFLFKLGYDLDVQVDERT